MHQDNFGEAVGMAKNYATKEARVEIDFDTNRWSGRMKNIVCKAIDTGVADCGWETAWWVEHFLAHHGLDTLNRGGWQVDIPLSYVREDKIEEAVAYMSALVRMKPEIFSYGRGEEHWLDKLDKHGISKKTRKEQNADKSYYDEGVCDVPLPDQWSKEDRTAFHKKYLKPQEEQEALKRAELINLIRSGSLLSISYIIN